MDKIRMVFLFMPEGIWQGIVHRGIRGGLKQGDVKEWNKIEERGIINIKNARNL